MKRGVKIIECLDADDPGSEGRCLKHIFNLMGVASSYSHVGSVDDLLSAITSSKFEYIHVSAHGELDAESERFRGWWTPKGAATKSRMASIVGKTKATAIVSTACKSGTTGFGRYVVDELGCKYFIGPERSPKFHNANFFAHIFYHKLFMTKGSAHEAFDSYVNQYKNPHRFRIHERRER